MVTAPTGDIVAVYRKSHLFDVELPEKGVSLKESAFTIPGPSLVSAVQTPIGKVSFYKIKTSPNKSKKALELLILGYYEDNLSQKTTIFFSSETLMQNDISETGQQEAKVILNC